MAFYTTYEFEYYDLENVLNRVEIQKDEPFPISSRTVNGTVTYSLSEVNSVDESIRGGGLTITLEDEGLGIFSDLYAATEKEFLVKYYRDGTLKFTGWLITDGIYEDFVNTNWNIELSVTDGLSFLKDLAYVDASGLQYTGKQTQLEIISNCLLRTGIEQNINTNIDIYYTGLSTSLDVLDNVYYNTDRFIKDDGSTIMDCEEVLRDVLEPYNAQIISYNGEWWIFKANQLYSDNTPTFFRYNSAGTYLGTATEDFSFDLGSQIDGYYPHHANANQLISYKKSIGAYRINYKYGLDLSLLDNIYLTHNGSTIDEWTINSSTNLTLNASGLGVDLDFDATTSVKNLTSDNIAVLADDLISYDIKFKTTALTKGTQTLYWGIFYYKIILTGSSTYYFNWVTSSPPEWTTTDTTLFSLGGDINTISGSSFDMPAAPEAGDITIEIWTPERNTDESGTFLLQEVSIRPTEESTADGAKKGEFHTFQRETNPSTNIKETKVVNVGDQPTDLYYGTIYKADSTTPTETWFRKGVTESKAILELMGEETLTLSQDTAREFTGDVYGFVEPLSIITINNITGIFLPMALNYDSVRNITNVKLRQIFNTTLTDLDYELTYDYGNTVKPTIKG